MSISLQINKEEPALVDMHFIPAKSSHNGNANVDSYFNNYTKTENGFMSNSLRGYPLHGIEFEVPTDFKGVIFQENKQTLDENADRLFKVNGTFNKFVYWNYDRVPSKGDVFSQAFQVIDIADELTKPISKDEVEKELNNNKKCNEIKTEL